MIRNLWLVFLALLFVIVIYIQGQIDPDDRIVDLSASQNIVRLVFLFIGALEFAGSFFLRQYLLKRKTTIPKLKDTEKNKAIVFRHALIRYRGAILLVSQITFGIALLGVILAFMGYGYIYLYGFSLAAVLALWIHRPKAEEFRTLLVRMKESQHE